MNGEQAVKPTTFFVGDFRLADRAKSGKIPEKAS